MSKHNILSLPKWAQGRIMVLEMRLREAREKVEEQANPGPTRVAVNPDPMRDDCADFWAPDDARVRFFLSDRRWITAVLEEGQLHLLGDGPLIIRPWVSNVVTVDVEP